MRIAIPQAEGKLALHFGHCENFAIVDVDEATKEISKKEIVTPPPHEPGVLPRWLAERGAQVIIASGMGQRAQQLFSENQIEVVVGASAGTPDEIVSAYLKNELKTGTNLCDH
jgi:predicted Fe-Mo cluster-binding NifX family protein